MYTQLWNKYFPIIKILLKRSATGNQSLQMDTTDFERAGINPKAGKKFSLHFFNGKPTHIVSNVPLAKELSDMLMQDGVVKELFNRGEYSISMNTKFQLSISCQTPVPTETEENAS